MSIIAKTYLYMYSISNIILLYIANIFEYISTYVVKINNGKDSKKDVKYFAGE